jgi:hypothetical protein
MHMSVGSKPEVFVSVWCVNGAMQMGYLYVCPLAINGHLEWSRHLRFCKE